ncbi:hypothetical protein QYF61_010297 [Mycteria americana]|uniref:Uncharacterized protein n=1 Tax=Mycteria americana TaxID=33587 RepID=A0AAN7RS62_MYCAM|nr:hypothetical protein QYF61_010297 [Mycteria americana]
MTTEDTKDEGVHCWRNQRVQNSHHQIQRWGGDGGGPQIGKYGSAEKHGDHSQVMEARGKGFVPSLLRGDPQYSPEDLHIGQHDENKTSKNKKSTNHNKANFPEVGTCTGELEDLRNFTEELVQGIALAEGYGKCIGCVQHSIEKPTAPGSCCHVDTSSAAQQGPVVQGFADGNVAVGIGHGFGDSGGDGAQVKNREVEEEEVQGVVEAVVAGYSSDDEAVAQEGSQVDAQEEPEVQDLQLPCVCKCQEEELGGGAAVGHLLPLGMGDC